MALAHALLDGPYPTVTIETAGPVHDAERKDAQASPAMIGERGHPARIDVERRCG